VSQYQKGKTNLDFIEARDSEWQWHQLGHVQVCTLLLTDNHASTPPLSFFYRPPNQQRQSTEGNYLPTCACIMMVVHFPLYSFLHFFCKRTSEEKCQELNLENLALSMPWSAIRAVAELLYWFLLTALVKALKETQGTDPSQRLVILIFIHHRSFMTAGVVAHFKPVSELIDWEVSISH